MQLLRVSIVDFWWGNDDGDACAKFLKKSLVCRGLREQGFQLELCFPASPAGRPDLVFFGPFGARFGGGLGPADFPGAVTIFNCDENLHGFPEFSRYAAYRDEYDFSFTYDHTTATNYRMTGLRAFADLPALEGSDGEAIPGGLQRDFACFLYSYGTPEQAEPEGVRLRNDFFTRLNARRRVNSGGAIMNNIGTQVPTGETGAFVGRHKFVLAMENAIHPGYVTEKIFHGFRHHAVPVYCGAPDIALDFDPRTFLHYTGDNFEQVVDAMFRIDADDVAFEDMLRRPKLASDPRPEFSPKFFEQFVGAIGAALRGRAAR
jgi:hypothetical protein